MSFKLRVHASCLILALALIATLVADSARAGVIELNQVCAASPEGCLPGDAPGFPIRIVTPGSYALTSDLVVSGLSQNAIEIATAGGVSLDLRGFAIKGPAVCTGSPQSISCGPGTGVGILASNPAATGAMLRIHDGRVEGFASHGLDLDVRSHIRNMIVRDCGTGIRTWGLGSIVSNSVAERSETYGFSTAFAIVYETTARSNRTYGFQLISSLLERSTARDGLNSGVSASQSLVREVTASQRSAYGLFEQQPGLILDSTSQGNGLDGVFLRGGALQGSVLRANNRYGLSWDSGFVGGSTLNANVMGNLEPNAPNLVDLGGNACDASATCP